MYMLQTAELKDIEDISIIHATCWNESYNFMPEEVLKSRNRHFRAAQWAKWFSDRKPQEELFKLIINNQIVGFCFCKPNDDPDVNAGLGEIHAAYILPEHRGGPTGPLMMRAMALHLLEQGLTPLVLWAFRSNRMRIAYAHLGWEQSVQRNRYIAGHALPEVGYIHNDALTLIKRLTNVINRHSP